MHKRAIQTIVICFAFILITSKIIAQTTNPVRIAVLAPLYLDSAFDNNNYKLGSVSIPRYILPGLDFYNGVMMAVDSLQKEGNDIDVTIYDTKKRGSSADALAGEMQSQHFSLIIASFTNVTEQKVFSDFAFTNNIPIVSATYPNDAYVTGNPFFIMVNSTITTHVEGLYKYLERTYPVAKFLYVTRKGMLEDKISSIFAGMGKKTYPMKYRTVELPDSFTVDQVLPLLDSTEQNVIICGSLDENFGSNLIKGIDENVNYPIVLAGMPTWDGLRAALQSQNENVSIVYSTPFNYPESNPVITSLSNTYRQKLNARPGDMVFKGYGTMFYFSKLLLKYHNDLLNNLSDNKSQVINNFQFQPVKLNSTAQVPDYIENKKLYFITLSQGTIKSVN